MYGVYVCVLCFDLKISEYVMQRFSPCCSCLNKSSQEQQPLLGWSDDSSLRLQRRSRADSGIFQNDSGYSQLSLSLHGLNEITHGTSSRHNLTHKNASRCLFVKSFKYHFGSIFKESHLTKQDSNVYNQQTNNIYK